LIIKPELSIIYEFPQNDTPASHTQNKPFTKRKKKSDKKNCAEKKTGEEVTDWPLRENEVEEIKLTK